MRKKLPVIAALVSILTASVSVVTAQSTVAQNNTGQGNVAVTAPSNATQKTVRTPKSLSDITGHWAEESIKQAIGKGYVDGYPDGTFMPDKPLTRAEFMKMIISSLNLPHGDNNAQDWFSPYVDSATSAGIMLDKEFDDYNKTITREEMAKLSVRAAFGDYSRVSADYSNFMYAATKNGLIHGLSNGNLGEKENTSRAQAITVIERISSIKSGKKLEADKSAVGYAEIAHRNTNLKTAWSVDPVSLPYNFALTNTATASVDQVIIVDKTDKNSTYYDQFAKAVKGGKQSLDNDYIVALKLTVNNNKSSGSHTQVILRQVLSMVNAAGVLRNEGDDIITYYSDEVGSTTGWYCFSVNKNEVDRVIKKDGYKRLILSTADGNDISLTKDPTK